MPYIVGPLARFNLNADRLSPAARAAAADAGAPSPVPQSVPEHRRAQRRDW